MFKLALIKDAIQRFDNHVVNLFLPYVPFARQDRVCDGGEAFSLAVFARFVASLGFNRVIIADPHSGVTPAAFEALGVKLTVLSQLDVLNKFTKFVPTLLGSELVSPDAGSNKKTSDAAGWLGRDGFIRADKLRDLTNGKIKEIVVYADDLKGKNAIILDDLCEFGGTFLGLAQVLKTKNCGKVILFATHGAFGGVAKTDATLENLFKNGIDEIWTTDSYNADLHEVTEIKFPNLHVLNLEKAFAEKF